MDAAPFPPSEERHRLTHSRQERMWAGVCGGLAEYFDIDPVLVRLVWVIATVLTAGLALVAYFCLVVIMPPDDRDWGGPESWSAAAGEGFGPTGRHEPGSTPETESFGSAGGPEPGSTPGGESFGAGSHEPFGHRAYRREFRHRPYRYGPYDYGHRRYTAGVILVVLGVLFLAGQAGLFRFINWNVIWPAVLIAIGVGLLFRHRD
ncbi:MAG: PspC domain-containing protein [Chloroflexota bacterium]|nr:PspC domain-containing protein [Chloroflexota bacterium]